MLSTPSDAVELSPWVIIRGEGQNASLALWNIAESSSPSLAIFSEQAKAEAYDSSVDNEAGRIVQLEGLKLVQLLADCYTHGIKYASLDPSQTSARQVFVLQDVLRAAQANLKLGKIDPT